MNKAVLLCTLLLAVACAAAAFDGADRVPVLGMAYNVADVAVEHGFDLGERAGDDVEHTLLFALRAERADELHALVRKVADPASGLFGRRFSREELAARFAPDLTDHVLVAWLDAAGVSYEVVPTGDVVVVTAPVRVLEELVGVTLHHYVHVDAGYSVVRSLEGAALLPADVAATVHTVGGISGFPPKRRQGAHVFERVLDGEFSPFFAGGGELVDDAAAEEEDDAYAPEWLVEEDEEAAAGPGFGIEFAASADSSIEVIFAFLCPNGNATSDPTHPCADQGGAVSSVTLTFGGEMPDLTLNTPYSDGESPVLCVETAQRHMCIAKVDVPNFEVLHVSGHAMFGATKVPNELPPVIGAASPFAMPQDIRNMYRIPNNVKARNPRTSNAVIEFSYQSFNPDDLRVFLDAMGLPQTSVKVHEPNEPTNPGGEGSLDIQYIAALAPNATNWYWGVDPGLGDGWMLAYTTTVARMGDDTVPLVHSISWGSDEAQTPHSYMTAVNEQLAKMALRGITVFVSSGDNGIGGRGANCSDFTVSFPAELPYVVSVGATQRSTQTSPLCGQAVYGLNEFLCETEGEITCSTSTGALITSGGGFSRAFARESWQDEAVGAYLAQAGKLPPHGAFDATGRAYPDVATLGHNFPIHLGGEWTVVDGTSASSPVMAAMATLWVDWHLNMHHTSFGWFTPHLYRMAHFDAHTFNDVVMGDNRCGESNVCCAKGFDAAVGYDAVTGLGSPDWTAVWGLMHDMTIMNRTMHIEQELHKIGEEAHEAGKTAEHALHKAKHDDGASSDAKAGVGLGVVALVLALVAIFVAWKKGSNGGSAQSSLHQPLSA